MDICLTKSLDRNSLPPWSEGLRTRRLSCGVKTAATGTSVQPHALQPLRLTATHDNLGAEAFGEFQYPTPPLAIYPAETIEAHRAFIARRRAIRPSDEYRTPTEEEWDAFLAHFEKRKVSIGTCARAFSSPCVHEHACIRCSLLRPDPAQRGRLEEIRDNLVARIAEAEREGWLGEVEGLKVSLAGAEDKLAQMDATTARTAATVDLGMPGFTQAAGRSSDT
ncbi:hypothetical protein ACIPJO_34430 [Streptomyces sp. NPDC086993]|uniref:hypothetical protein n=1 Tax=unclassified Streptomyces TaxID=2593676 RepID=UPI0034375209